MGHQFAVDLDHDELREVLVSVGLPYLIAMVVAAWLIHSSTGLASRLDRLPWCVVARLPSCPVPLDRCSCSFIVMRSAFLSRQTSVARSLAARVTVQAHHLYTRYCGGDPSTGTALEPACYGSWRCNIIGATMVCRDDGGSS